MFHLSEKKRNFGNAKILILRQGSSHQLHSTNPFACGTLIMVLLCAHSVVMCKLFTRSLGQPIPV